jgi:hypothetical protein
MDSLITAAQDQAINTHYHQRNIIKQPTDKCRMHYKAEEHINHIVVGCTTLTPSEYTNRQNKVACYIHWTICKHMGLQVAIKDYEHTPEKVINVNNTTIKWEIVVITDQTILAS